ncbi:MAG TPA: hypothetical protein VGI40_12895 [Pirellulaceae bacterium]|jgi:hypothetical protein
MLFHGRFSCAFLVPATFWDDKRTPELRIAGWFRAAAAQPHRSSQITAATAKRQFQPDDAPPSANVATSHPVPPQPQSDDSTAHRPSVIPWE